jgi:hypothetical protein
VALAGNLSEKMPEHAANVITSTKNGIFAASLNASVEEEDVL